MKIYIGPYRTWVGPWQIANFITKNDDRQEKIVDFFDRIGITKFLNWIDSFKKRDIRVKIHDYDVWNMDGTLAYIILPMLKMVKEQKHAVPGTVVEDAPHITDAPDTDEYNVDYSPERWNYILDEMIWAFEQLNSDWEDQYHQDEKFDYEGCKKHQERMNNGFRLFGKYYQSLWT
ncbi:hypothetical protein UFOVP787_51 [uncultured Caudovirales phage]|uniref:Uncharacterized protein n=1 Tax=uncultured Caudovirales phage TaxID=2100421 RepID=A0A6J5NRU9_9CAUD|nr:hypothetical protein UFOVP787_51 [uncultured Caudovirales phage]